MVKLIEKMKGYKATDKDMCCRGFQFEIGKWYEHSGDIELCNSGFHFCVYPSGVYCYHDLGCRVFEIEAELVLETHDEAGADLKKVCKRIKLVKEIFADGNRNTGDGNTGYGNTGYGNTGNGNCCDRSSGHFNTKTPKIIMFDKPVKDESDINNFRIYDLSVALLSDVPFDYADYLDIPNATVEKIKKLHELHISKRGEK
jgi:hypothetical protein